MGTTSKMERKTKAQRTRKERWIRKARSWNQNLLKMEMLMMRVEGQEGQSTANHWALSLFTVFWHSNTFVIHLLVFDIGLGLLATCCHPVPPPICCLRFSLRFSNISENVHRKVTGYPIRLGWMLEALHPFGRRLLALPIDVWISVVSSNRANATETVY